MANREQSRLDYTALKNLAPGVVDALTRLGKAVDDSGLEKPLTELLKIRVSQLNGCAFCLRLHLNLARKVGVEPVKIDLVATWNEVGIYSARERAALAWAEALTRMGQQAIPEAAYSELQKQFSLTEIAFLTASIGAINAWNRVAGGLRFPPPIPHAGSGATEKLA